MDISRGETPGSRRSNTSITACWKKRRKKDSTDVSFHDSNFVTYRLKAVRLESLVRKDAHGAHVVQAGLRKGLRLAVQVPQPRAELSHVLVVKHSHGPNNRDLFGRSVCQWTIKKNIQTSCIVHHSNSKRNNHTHGTGDGLIVTSKSTCNKKFNKHHTKLKHRPSAVEMEVLRDFVGGVHLPLTLTPW